MLRRVQGRRQRRRDLGERRRLGRFQVQNLLDARNFNIFRRALRRFPSPGVDTLPHRRFRFFRQFRFFRRFRRRDANLSPSQFDVSLVVEPPSELRVKPEGVEEYEGV